MAYLTLGIETSCDETAAAVYDSKRGPLSNKLFSQITLQEEFGGVVPEVASRSHLEKINHIVELALEAADTSLDDIDAVAVTNKPGLPGSLLVGLCFAKALAWTKQKKIIGVNHLEGHAFSPLLEHDVPFPHLTITASGGHTAMYMMYGLGQYKLIGHTHDDAAGEAFDKIAKLIGLTYPGGPLIEKLAQEVNFKDFFKYPRSKMKGLDFSFSVLKTAVLYDLVKRNAYDMQTKTFLQPENHELKQHVSSSLLVCITDIFQKRIERALKLHPEAKAVTFAGGVACNEYIKSRLSQFCTNRGLPFYAPSKQYCTDNAAMIALVGNYKAEQGLFSKLDLDIFDR